MLASLLKSLYHVTVPLRVRRALRLTRFTPSRQGRARLWRQTQGRVAAGPFAGMRLAGDLPDDSAPNELLGSFECELHPWIDAELARGWGTVVNIGSGGGYYSTGMALRLPAATVYAFELQDSQREATKRSAERNGVGERVHALGAATTASLSACRVDREQGALVICDCEGAERDILDPAQVPWMLRSTLIVELHDFAAAGATDTLRARFAPTHAIEIIDQQPRDAAEWASRAGVSVADSRLLADEQRLWGTEVIAARWMLLRPLA